MNEMFQTLMKEHPDGGHDDSVKVYHQEWLPGFSVSCYDRIIFFDDIQEGESLYIDFYIHGIQDSLIYIIPAYHLLYIPLNCMSHHKVLIPSHQLSISEKLFFYSFKYQLSKSVKVNKDEIHPLVPVSTLVKKIRSSAALPGGGGPVKYFNMAEHIIQLLHGTAITHEVTPQFLASRLFVSQATLYRICHSAFRCAPQTLTRYHLLVKIVFKLLHEINSSISCIAHDLAFKDASTFTKVAKSLSGLSPKEIRQYFSFVYI